MCVWGGGQLNRFYAATTLALSSAVVYTRRLFTPREAFQTSVEHLPEHKTSNEYRDEITMRTRQQEITEMLKRKKSNSRTPVGPTRARTSGTNRHLKVFRPEPSYRLRTGHTGVQTKRGAKPPTVTGPTTTHAARRITPTLHQIPTHQRKTPRNRAPKS